MAQSRAALAQREQRLAAEAHRLEDERRDFFERARADVGSLVRRGRQELDALLAALRQRPSPEAAAGVRAYLRDLARASEAYASEAPRPQGEAPDDLRVGEAVHVASLGRGGVVQAVPDARGEVEVQAGSLKVRVPLSDLRRLPAGGLVDLPSAAAPSTSGLDKTLAVGATLDLRGRTADDAIEELDKYLDDATLAGLQRITVIHGKGTGALRQAVREHLSRHPEVAAFRLGKEAEGGSGATIVDLAQR